jgi:uncharacterized protein YjeT (DUF2065 family)
VVGELAAALCLVLVMEGLLLFASPGLWKRMAEQMQQLDAHTLRLVGASMIGVGLILLKIVR